MVIAPARIAGEPDSNPGPGENFSLKLLILTCQMVILKAKIIYICSIHGCACGKKFKVKTKNELNSV